MGNEVSAPLDGASHQQQSASQEENNSSTSNDQLQQRLKSGVTTQQSKGRIANFMRSNSKSLDGKTSTKPVFSGRDEKLHPLRQETEIDLSNHYPLHQQNGDSSSRSTNSNYSSSSKQSKVIDRQSSNRKQRTGNNFQYQQGQRQISSNRDNSRTYQQQSHVYSQQQQHSQALINVMYTSRSSSSISPAHREPRLLSPRHMSEISQNVGEISLQVNEEQGSKSSIDNNMRIGTNDQQQWQNIWDEDTESSDGEDDSDAGSDGATVTGHKGEGSIDIEISTQTPQILRPEMDGTHSSSFVLHVEAIDDYSDHHHQKTSLPSTHRSAAQSKQQNQRTPQHLLMFGHPKISGEGGNSLQLDTHPTDQNEYVKPNSSMFFPLLRVLGKGSFGKVVLVQKQTGKETGGLFAMKILRKTHLLRRGQIERTKTERKVLSLVNHPFIMKLHFAFQTDDKLFFVLDYCAGGELFFHLSRHRRFPEKFARFYSAELLLALAHCHENGIIYRDLKPENVLLDSEGHVKLGDFGLAKDNIRHPYKGATSMCGTPEYMAPEILQQFGHGFCVDYWGLGMLVYEMMTGLPPWYTKDRQTLYRRLKSAQLDIPPFFSAKASSFVYSLLQRDPRRRLGVRGARNVVSHEFFRGLDFRLLLQKGIDPPIRPCEAWRKQEALENNIEVLPEKESNGVPNNSTTRIKSTDLDVATACFDKQFLRMPVNSNEQLDGSAYSDDDTGRGELNENTFVGFTFDEQNNSTQSD